jgi:predicted small metal-binding protein
MSYTLICKDAGVDCANVIQGETEEEVLREGFKHLKEAHGYTEEQLSYAKFVEETRKQIKES